MLLVNREIEHEDVRKINVKHFLKGVKDNPRLLEPGIALLVKYPNTLLDPEKLPEDLAGFIEAIKRNRIDPEEKYGHAQAKKVIQLCNIKAKQDGRLKRIENLKTPKTFRLENLVVQGMEKLKNKFELQTNTEVIEFLVKRELNDV